MREQFIRSDRVAIPLLSEPFCVLCSNPIRERYLYCYWCHKNKFLEPFIQIRAVEYYFEEDELKTHRLSQELRSFKFKNEPQLASKLGECLVYVVQYQYPELMRMNCIVSVPKASSTRSYDQAQLLAEYVSNRTGIPYYDALYTKEQYSPMYNLDLSQRTQLIEGKIDSSYDFKNNSVVLIDDICTTGVTLRECAKVLLEHDASFVRGLVVGKKVDKLLLKTAGREDEYK